jgi:RimJ/RimL family protein N-acetyltransferase
VPFTLEHCKVWAARDAAHWAAHGFGPYLWLDRGVPVAHGGLGFNVAGGRGEIEIGWFVARKRWREGIGTLIARAALAEAAERGFAGVVAFTRTDNAASRGVMEKVGLRQEREFEHAGLPHVLYRAPASMTR